MNRTLNIRIVELLTKEKRTSFKYLYFLTNTTENFNREIKMKIVPNKSGKLLICEKPISFDLDSQLNNTIHMKFKRNRFILSDDLIGKVDLPLTWFPSNHIVREWFPIKLAGDGKEGGMILLDIHVDCRGASPFMAPFAPLKIKPSWRRPELNENAEILVDQYNQINDQNQPNSIPNAIQYQNYPAPCFYPVYQLPPNWQYHPYFQQALQQMPQNNMNPNHQQAMMQNNQRVNQQGQHNVMNQIHHQNTENHDQFHQPQQDLQSDLESQVYYPQVPMFSSPYSKNNPYQEEELKDETS